LPQNLAADLELHLYRIIQEALGNIEKHSRASHVNIECTKQVSNLLLGPDPTRSGPFFVKLRAGELQPLARASFYRPSFTFELGRHLCVDHPRETGERAIRESTRTLPRPAPPGSSAERNRIPG